MTMNELLNDAIVAFAKLVKLNPKDWHHQDLLKEINRSRELDPSGITTFLLIQGHLDEHIQGETFTAKEIIEDPDGFKQRIDYLVQTREMVLHRDTLAPREEFKDQIKHRAHLLGMKDLKPLTEVLDDPMSLGYIRWSALKSSKDLEAFQFTQGDPEETPLEVNNTIFEFWNVNSLLRLLQAQGTPGTTMCLIRDPQEVFASYFVFAIKNGDLITLLTDREKGAHPLYWKMTRRPDRSLERRRLKHWFPYDLLDLKPSKQSWGWTAESRTSLVPVQAHMIPLKKISELAPEEFVWAVLTMGRINEIYGRKSRKLPRLGYTAEMIVDPAALVSPGSALMRKGYQPLSLPTLTKENVTREALVPQLRDQAVGWNEWLVQRFKDQVPEEVLNVVGGEETQKLLGKKYKGLVPSNERHMSIEALNPALFGTAEEIAQDRLWLARRNQAEVIDELARAEFKKESPRVLRWMKDRLQERLPYLVEMAATGVWETPMTVCNRSDGFEHGRSDVVLGDFITSQILSKNRTEAYEATRGYGSYYEGYGIFALGRYDDKVSTHWRCAIIDKSIARVFTKFTPECPASLAVLLGLEVKDLPIWLQHWHSTEPYHGNSILERLDPADFAIENPWHEHLKFEVLLCLSPRAFNAERARLGLAEHSGKTKVVRGRRPFIIKWGGKK